MLNRFFLGGMLANFLLSGTIAVSILSCYDRKPIAATTKVESPSNQFVLVYRQMVEESRVGRFEIWRGPRLCILVMTLTNHGDVTYRAEAITVSRDVCESVVDSPSNPIDKPF